MTFGEFVREKRLSLDLGLRKFCELTGWDPANWSRIERGRFNPPPPEKLKTVADVLKLSVEETVEFNTRASLARKEIPLGCYTDEEVLSVLPIFFTTISGKKPTKDQLNNLITLLKNR